jgi:hypothetical protein
MLYVFPLLTAGYKRPLSDQDMAKWTRPSSDRVANTIDLTRHMWEEELKRPK